jgi:7-cyano-7-deazaguanine synthase
MKTLIVLSGGMDSTVALAQCLETNNKDNIESITFNYGSKHNERENIAAKKISDFYGIKNKLVYLPFINELFKSDLLLSGGNIPEGHYADPSMKKTVVPFRNGIMLAITAGYAESINANKIILGNHVGDHSIYPDCTKEFTDPMAEAIKNGTYTKVELINPFGKINKTDICRIGYKLNVPFELTWSCYVGGEKHCGKCGTCYERKEAFNDSGVNDVTEYSV